jgi:YHS domain-containing protein
MSDKHFLRRTKMNGKKNNLKRMTFVAVMLVAGLIAANGCKKSEPEPATPATPSTPAAPTMEDVTKTAAKTAAETTEAAKETIDKAVETIEQTTCPVMGAPINKALFTEYKGKKVYFCCEGCKEKFEQAPEQYVAKLPQFQEE